MKRSFPRAKRIIAFVLVWALALSIGILPASAENIYAYVNGSQSLSVYSDAALTQRKSDTSLNPYAVVRVYQYTDKSAAVSNGSVAGYVDISRLTLLSQQSNVRIITEKTRVYASPDTSSASMSVPKDMTVYEILRSGDWAWVANGVYTAYIQTAYLRTQDESSPTPTPTPEPTKTATPTTIPATVIASGAKLYASQSTSSPSMDIAIGEKVNVLQINGSWTYLEYNGVKAYCPIASLVADEYLAKHPELLQTPTPTPSATATPSSNAIPATVIASNAKLYASPSTSANSMDIAIGEKVNVLQINGSWTYLEYNGVKAYCPIASLAADEYLAKHPELLQTPTPTPSATATPSSNAIPATVIASNAKLYASPSTSANSMDIAIGEKVNVLQINGSWTYLEYNGVKAYCPIASLAADEYLAKHPELLQTPTPSLNPLEGYIQDTFDATVVVSDARFYASASTNANNVSAPMGTNVTVMAYNSSWAYVQLNGVNGYIPVSHLSRNNYSQIRKGATGSDVRNLESALLSLGYLDKVPGTDYNDYTAWCVQNFQKACGMSATGEADIATLRVLYSGNAPKSSLLSGTYSRGNSGDNISHIQLRLYALGYLSKASSVDGDYGINTYNAVGLFQVYNDLDATGAVDSTTLRKLYSENAVALPSGKTPGDGSDSPQPSAGNQKNNSTEISDGLKSTTTKPGSSDVSKLEYVIYLAQNQLGKPYVYGANGTSSYDCTGFTCYCFKQIGIKLKRSAIDQGYDNTYPKITSVNDLRRGDLVFFNTISDGDESDHAGIYLGAGYFIHASSGQKKVVISTLMSGYYNRVFSWGRRVLAG